MLLLTQNKTLLNVNLVVSFATGFQQVCLAYDRFTKASHIYM